jgi:mono/diheme cytochrome c family protein
LLHLKFEVGGLKSPEGSELISSRRSLPRRTLMSTSKQTRPLFRVVLGALIVVAAFGAASAYIAFGPGATDFARGRRVALRDYSGHDPSGVPKELASASLSERGEYLTRAADCVVCHTAKDGTPFIGGRAFVLPFGTLYSTNITPDSETGIGKYTDADFLNALHRGIARNGKKLYPGMPYPSYTLMSDADALAIKAFLFTLPAVHAPPVPNTLAFPFNQRALMSAWSAFFNPGHRYKPNQDQSDEWNRGAYLAEAMEHCGECHTPRTVFFSMNNRKKFQGAVQAGWRAYNITADRDSGIGAWSKADIARYLSLGHSEGRGAASGPMAEAVDESMSFLSSSDIEAMATYLRTIPPARSSDLAAPRMTPAAAEAEPGGDNGAPGAPTRAKEIYEEACAGCHGWSGTGSVIPTANLTGTRAVNDPTAINVAQIILHGVEHSAAEHSATEHSADMPPFDTVFSDADIATVANYVTSRFGAHSGRLNASDIARLRAAD